MNNHFIWRFWLKSLAKIAVKSLSIFMHIEAAYIFGSYSNTSLKPHDIDVLLVSEKTNTTTLALFITRLFNMLCVDINISRSNNKDAHITYCSKGIPTRINVSELSPIPMGEM